MPTHGINLVEGSPLWLSSADAGSRSEGPYEEARRVVMQRQVVEYLLQYMGIRART